MLKSLHVLPPLVMLALEKTIHAGFDAAAEKTHMCIYIYVYISNICIDIYIYIGDLSKSFEYLQEKIDMSIHANPIFQSHNDGTCWPAC